MKFMAAHKPEMDIADGKPVIRPATTQDARAVIELLRAQWPKVSASEWERIFRLPWPSSDDDIGFVLVDGNRIVGFIGTVCSSREIDGQRYELCNLVGWCVQPEYLTSSLGLLNAVIRTGRVITAVTPASVTQQIMNMLGFTLLETERRVFLPFADLGTRSSKKVKLLSGIGRIERYLAPLDKTIMRDHSKTLCRHHLLLTDDGYSYIVTRRANQGLKSLVQALGARVAKASGGPAGKSPVGRLADTRPGAQSDHRLVRAAAKLARVPASEILYCSHPDLLMAHLERAKLGILRRDRTIALIGDSRLLEAGAARGLRIPSIKYFRGNNLKACQIDNLYTEYVLLPL
jgi:acetoacetyl-CoA synthetase